MKNFVILYIYSIWLYT